jgi:hypothetical protein
MATQITCRNGNLELSHLAAVRFRKLKRKNASPSELTRIDVLQRQGRTRAEAEAEVFDYHQADPSDPALISILRDWSSCALDVSKMFRIVEVPALFSQYYSVVEDSGQEKVQIDFSTFLKSLSTENMSGSDKAQISDELMAAAAEF